MNALTDLMKRKQTKTLDLIYSRPVNGSIKWRDIESLFLALGAEILEREGSRVAVILFDEVKENPTSADVEKCVAAAQGQGCELIIGLGGGSSLDTAKAFNFVVSGGGKIQDYRGIGKAKVKMLPLIAIPTTSGTGSEATHFSVVYREGIKYSVAENCMLPAYVILNPSLTLGMTPYQTACTG